MFRNLSAQFIEICSVDLILLVRTSSSLVGFVSDYSISEIRHDARILREEFGPQWMQIGLIIPYNFYNYSDLSLPKVDKTNWGQRK
jgi:hypothetical protein